MELFLKEPCISLFGGLERYWHTALTLKRSPNGRAQYSCSNIARILTHYPGTNVLFRYSNSTHTLKQCPDNKVQSRHESTAQKKKHSQVTEPLSRFWSYVSSPKNFSNKKALPSYWNVDQALRHWSNIKELIRCLNVHLVQVFKRRGQTRRYSYLLNIKPFSHTLFIWRQKEKQRECAKVGCLGGCGNTILITRKEKI